MKVMDKSRQTKLFFVQVLHYLYSGKMEFEDLNLQDTLDLLHLIQFMKMNLFTTLESYLINKIEEGGFSFEKILLHLNVTESSKYSEVLKAMLRYLYHHIKEIADLSEVKYLSSTLLRTFIKYTTDIVSVFGDEGEVYDDEAIYEEEDWEEDDSESEYTVDMVKRYQIEMFKIFVNWLEGNSGCEKEFKGKILKQFSLEGFTNEELITCVRGSSLYSEKEILDSLSKNVRTLEGEIKSTKEDLDNCKKHKIDVENENNRIKNETKKIKLENEKLRDQLNKHKIERNRLNAQIRQFTLDNQKLKGLINSGKGIC